jgi:hypothetical protein
MKDLLSRNQEVVKTHSKYLSKLHRKRGEDFSSHQNTPIEKTPKPPLVPRLTIELPSPKISRFKDVSKKVEQSPSALPPPPPMPQ